MSHIALAWLGTRVDSVIIGINSLPYMEELLEAQGLRLTAAEDAFLSEPYVPKDVQGHS